MAAFGPALGQSLRSRPPRNPNSQKNDSPRQLEFTSAMEDFKKMFPSMDTEVIEAVLRANNGLVDATIDQLLSMGAGDESKEEFPHLPSYVDTGPREPPPAYSPREESDSSDGRPLPARPYSAWNPPLLGNLPDDFLRFTHIPPSKRSTSPSISPSLSTDRNNDKILEQFLEDEKLAQVLQNEEFVRELSRNKDFMMSLERDKQRNMALNNTNTNVSETPAPPHTASLKTVEAPPSSHGDNNQDLSSLGAVGGPPPQEDVVLREKLKHMGKSTRRKLDKMARIFHRKKNTQKANLMVSGSAASTANLLEEYEDDDDELLNTMAAGRLEIINDAESENEKSGDKNESSKESPPPARVYDPFDPVEFYAEDNEFKYKSEK